MLEAYKAFWKNSFNLSGRCRRRDFWLAYLANFIVLCILEIPNILISEKLIIFFGLYALAMLIPSFCILVRRLHDINKSGFNVLWRLIPLIGGVIVLVLTCLDGTPGTNKYGANPKDMESNLELNSL